jgi:predicted membrane channel-forming protein YqfA (hemolysin III family)
MDWTTWRNATCLPECWCEAARTGSWILEPVNTWTNLVFIVAGLVFIFRAEALTTNKNQLSSRVTFPRLYGFALIFLGLGSFFYHASQTFAGQWFDVFGMYLVSMFYISYNLFRIGRLHEKSFLYFYFGSCVLLGFVIYFFPESRRWLFGVSIAFTFLQSIWIQKRLRSMINSKYLFGAVAAYALAQSTWVLDKNRIWCDPNGWMNGHGIWHLFTGVAAVLIYFYFNSERASTVSRAES